MKKKRMRPGGRQVAHKVVEYAIIELGTNEIHKWYEHDVTEAYKALIKAAMLALTELEQIWLREPGPESRAARERAKTALREALAKVEA